MKLYHIVACTKNGVIGKNGRLPWHFREDLKHFKSLTLGSTVMMGWKTFEGIGKSLPGRENFVLSRNKTRDVQGVRFFHSLADALRHVTTEKVFIIGGADIFRQTMDLIDGIYMTQIEGTYEGDAYYPVIPNYFEEKLRQPSKEEPKLEFIFYENVKKK